MGSPSAASVSSDAESRQRRASIVLYLVAAFLFWMAQYIYAPTLPTYVQLKAADLATVGVILSMYGLWQAIIRLPFGIAADAAGWRKPFILFGLVLSGLGAWLIGTATDATGLLVGRSVTGLAAATWVPLIVAFSALFPPAQAVRATAMLTAANSLGRIFGTSVTATLNQWGGYPLAFFAATGIAAVSILAVLPVREVRRTPRVISPATIAHLITRPDVLFPSLLSAVTQYANYAITYSFLPLLVKNMGGSDVDQGIVMTLGIVVYTGGSLLASGLANRVGSHVLVNWAFILFCIGIGMGAVAPSLAWVFCAQLVLGLAMGIVYPVLMGLSIQQVNEQERATAMGLHQAIYAIGMFAGPAASGWLAAAIGLQPMFGVTAVMCLVLGLGGTRLMRAPHAV